MAKQTRKQALKKALSLENIAVTFFGIEISAIPCIMNRGVEWSSNNHPNSYIIGSSLCLSLLGSAFVSLGIIKLVKDYQRFRNEYVQSGPETYRGEEKAEQKQAELLRKS